MQFTTLALSAMSVAGALAQSGMTTVHVVKVGSMNGSKTFSPNELKAAVGDMVQFQFGLANHTVTQSTFDNPCTPISAIQKNVTGIYSGFMPVKATDTNTPTYTIMVNSTTPMWLYCSQAAHCQGGMVMAINVNTAANSTRTLANYAKLASKATANLAPGGVSGGVSGLNSTSPSSDSGSGTSGSGSGSSGSGSGTANGGAAETSSGSGAASTSSAAGKTNGTTSFAVAVRPGDAISFGSLVAMGLAMLF